MPTWEEIQEWFLEQMGLGPDLWNKFTTASEPYLAGISGFTNSIIDQGMSLITEFIMVTLPKFLFASEPEKNIATQFAAIDPNIDIPGTANDDLEANIKTAIKTSIDFNLVGWGSMSSERTDPAKIDETSLELATDVYHATYNSVINYYNKFGISKDDADLKAVAALEAQRISGVTEQAGSYVVNPAATKQGYFGAIKSTLSTNTTTQPEFEDRTTAHSARITTLETKATTNRDAQKELENHGIERAGLTSATGVSDAHFDALIELVKSRSNAQDSLTDAELDMMQAALPDNKILADLLAKITDPSKITDIGFVITNAGGSNIYQIAAEVQGQATPELVQFTPNAGTTVTNTL